MPRDTYHDFIEHQELAEHRWPVRASFILDMRLRDLLDRSGARHVTSSALKQFDDPRTLTRQIAVDFNSSAWTGR